MSGKIAPSIMCANLRHLEADVMTLAEAGVEYFHFDIMDGHFVPNFTLGPDLVRAVRSITNIPFDLHLMVEKPEQHLSLFDIRPGDIVSIHQEATVHAQRVLQKIKDIGARPALALNPATPLVVLEDLLPDLEVVLLMTVNPGFAGQKMIPATLSKIARLRQMLRDWGYDAIDIEVDGNVSFENARKMRAAGADIFVAGTASIFNSERNLSSGIRYLRKAIST